MDIGRGLGVGNAATLFSSIFITHCYIRPCLQRIWLERAKCLLHHFTRNQDPIHWPRTHMLGERGADRKNTQGYFHCTEIYENKYGALILQTRKQSLCARNEALAFLQCLCRNTLQKCFTTKLTRNVPAKSYTSCITSTHNAEKYQSKRPTFLIANISNSVILKSLEYTQLRTGNKSM